jgi:putative transposase
VRLREFVDLPVSNASLDDMDEKCRYVIHDRDASFAGFDFVLKAQGIKIVKTPPKAPICNAHAERFVREARETLNKIIPLGQWHFHHVLKCIENHHNKERPHQGIGNRIPLDFNYPKTSAEPYHVGCKSCLGGLLNHYFKKRPDFSVSFLLIGYIVRYLIRR